MLTRRSTAALHPPAPSDDEIEAILRAATTVPDHGTLRPWRFLVVAGDARDAFGEALAAAAAEPRQDLDEATLERIRSKAFVAPALIAVAAHVDPTAKVEVWEQVASATCAGYAIALAAHQLGLGAIWKSAPVHAGEAIEKALDLSPDDVFLGWVNLGSTGPDREVPQRPEVDLGAIVRSARRRRNSPALRALSLVGCRMGSVHPAITPPVAAWIARAADVLRRHRAARRRRPREPVAEGARHAARPRRPHRRLPRSHRQRRRDRRPRPGERPHHADVVRVRRAAAHRAGPWAAARSSASTTRASPGSSTSCRAPGP